MSDYFILYHRRLQCIYVYNFCAFSIYTTSLCIIFVLSQCLPSLCMLFVRPRIVSYLCILISASSVFVFSQLPHQCVFFSASSMCVLNSEFSMCVLSLHPYQCVLSLRPHQCVLSLLPFFASFLLHSQCASGLIVRSQFAFYLCVIFRKT